jgi:hypothetical protein
MDRVTLRLELLRIAHHPAQNYETTLEIARGFETAFDDLKLEGADAAPTKPQKPAKT